MSKKPKESLKQKRAAKRSKADQVTAIAEVPKAKHR